MSILEEALRRKAAESGTSAPPPHPPIPVRQPPPLPPRRKRRRLWPLGLVILLLVAITGGILLLRLGWPTFRLDLSRLWRTTETPAETPDADPEGPRTMPGKLLRQTRAVLSEVARSRSASVDEETPLDVGGATGSTEPATPDEPPRAAAEEPRAPLPPPVAPPPPVPVRWPKLTLQATVATRSPATSQAIINGRMLRIGDRIEGATLVAIEEGAVILDLQGHRRELRVGVAWE